MKMIPIFTLPVEDLKSYLKISFILFARLRKSHNIKKHQLQLLNEQLVEQEIRDKFDSVLSSNLYFIPEQWDCCQSNRMVYKHSKILRIVNIIFIRSFWHKAHILPEVHNTTIRQFKIFFQRSSWIHLFLFLYLWKHVYKLLKMLTNSIIFAIQKLRVNLVPMIFKNKNRDASPSSQSQTIQSATNKNNTYGHS